MDASITVRLIDETQRGFSQINSNLDRINKTSNTLQSSMRNLTTAASAFVGALGAREIGTYLSNMQNLDNRLRLVTSSQQELNKRFDDLFVVAQKTRAPIRESIDLYVKLAQAQDIIGKSGSDLTKIVEAFNMSLAISGTSGAGAAAAILQFSQAMQSGRLNGDEFRTMLEQAPRFLKALSDATGIAQGRLKEFASKGLLDSKIVAQALIDELPKLTKEFGKTGVTIGQATTQIQNSFLRLVRSFDEATGASDAIVAVLQFLERNLKIVTVALGAFAGAMAITAVVNAFTLAIGYATAGVKALGAALVFLGSTPIGRVVSLLGIAAGAFLAFSNESEAAEKKLEELGDAQSQVTKELLEGQGPTREMQNLMRNLGVSASGTTDAYADFIHSLKQEIELSRLDSKEKAIQQNVYKALAAEAKKYGGDLSRISETRRQEIEEEVRAVSRQVEEEKEQTELRKKFQDDLRRKQEEFDKFIEGSRAANLTGLQKFYADSAEADRNYRNGLFRDEQQFQEYMAALKKQYQVENANRAAEIIKKQLTDEQNYQREIEQLTRQHQEGLIADEETFQILREGIRQEYGKKFDDMAKKQREDEMTAVEKYHKDITELNKAANAGLIKSQEDYDAIRRKIDKDYVKDTVSEYSNLYGLLNDKLMEWSGLTQKEYGVVRDVIKLTFGVDVEDLIKEFFAASIRYLLGFRTAAEKDMGIVGSTINKVFGSNGDGIKDIGGFEKDSTSIFGRIGNVIGDVFNGGLDFIGAFVKGGLELLMGFGKGAGSIFDSIGGWISSIFKGGGGGGGFSLGNIFDTVFDFGGDILGGIGDIFTGGISGVGDVLGSIGDFVMDIPVVGDVLGGIGDIFTGGGAGFGADLLGGIGNIGLVGAGLSLLETVGDALGFGFLTEDLPPTPYELGKQQEARVAAFQQKEAVKKTPEYKGQQAFIAAQERVNMGMGTAADHAALGLPPPFRLGRSDLMEEARFRQAWTPFSNLGVPIDPKWKGVYYYAKGGIINTPTMFNMSQGFGVAGEAGAEAILPLSIGPDGTYGVQAMAGDVNVNFTINALDAKGVDELLIDRRQLITNMVRSAVAEKGKIGRFI